MKAINIQYLITSKNDSPGDNEDDVDSSKPKGRTSIENDATKWTVESHIIAKEIVRIGTWNVRTLNIGNLEVVKREIEKTDVDLLGISEMKWTGMGYFTSDEHDIYYCEQKTLNVMEWN